MVLSELVYRVRESGRTSSKYDGLTKPGTGTTTPPAREFSTQHIAPAQPHSVAEHVNHSFGVPHSCRIRAAPPPTMVHGTAAYNK